MISGASHIHKIEEVLTYSSGRVLRYTLYPTEDNLNNNHGVCMKLGTKFAGVGMNSERTILSWADYIKGPNLVNITRSDDKEFASCLKTLSQEEEQRLIRLRSLWMGKDEGLFKELTGAHKWLAGLADNERIFLAPLNLKVRMPNERKAELTITDIYWRI